MQDKRRTDKSEQKDWVILASWFNLSCLRRHKIRYSHQDFSYDSLIKLINKIMTLDKWKYLAANFAEDWGDNWNTNEQRASQCPCFVNK